MWWMSGVVDVRCGGCLVLWMSSVVDVWCGGCPILHMVWWMSGVVDVCVVDVVQSVLDISCQQLGDECKLEGFCVPFGHRVGECTFLKMYICIGYVTPKRLGGLGILLQGLNFFSSSAVLI